MYLSDSRNSYFAYFSRSGSSKIFLGAPKARKIVKSHGRRKARKDEIPDDALILERLVMCK
jgi:hypothetical protein